MKGMRAEVLRRARRFLRQQGLDAWLLHDFRGSNPIFARVVGEAGLVTRPCFLLVPPRGRPRLLAHFVDAGHLRSLGLPLCTYSSRADLERELARLLRGRRRVAMEYFPRAEVPRASRVDAGTLELVRSLGVEVVPSADLFQYSALRWSPAQVASHRRTARALTRLVGEAFARAFAEGGRGLDEVGLQAFLRRRMEEEGLLAPDGPIVAVNEHSADPHYEPTPSTCAPIRPGDWLLIDIWAREPGPDGVYADITWVAYLGERVPEPHRRAFRAVAGARDRAVDFLRRAFREGRPVQGWEVDRVARDYLRRRGYGRAFRHRLGHSLGTEVHGDAVNLDGWETRDTRRLLPGLAVTVEPGVYLKDFGCRSEINLLLTPRGPVVTTPIQREVVVPGGPLPLE